MSPTGEWDKVILRSFGGYAALVEVGAGGATVRSYRACCGINCMEVVRLRGPSGGERE